jgi:RimJ/RimL family protein N-acetyltransferase
VAGASIIELETPRLLLRQWRDDDLEPFAELNSDLRVMEFYPRPLTKQESDEMAHRIRSLIAERGWGLWAVELKSSGAFGGYVGLNVPSAELPFSPCVEIGWRLAVAYWGKGYASEAARAALGAAFERLALPEVVSFTAVHNTRSRRVMERIGMQSRGERFEHPALPEGSPLREHVLYRLQRAAYVEISRQGGCWKSAAS